MSGIFSDFLIRSLGIAQASANLGLNTAGLVQKRVEGNVLIEVERQSATYQWEKGVDANLHDEGSGNVVGA